MVRKFRYFGEGQNPDDMIEHKTIIWLFHIEFFAIKSRGKML